MAHRAKPIFIARWPDGPGPINASARSPARQCSAHTPCSARCPHSSASGQVGFGLSWRGTAVESQVGALAGSGFAAPPSTAAAVRIPSVQRRQQMADRSARGPSPGCRGSGTVIARVRHGVEPVERQSSPKYLAVRRGWPLLLGVHIAGAVKN